MHLRKLDFEINENRVSGEARKKSVNNALFTDFDTADSVHRDWNQWDTFESVMGPGSWTISPNRRSIRQSSSIFGARGRTLGTCLIYRHGLYDRGFSKSRITFSGANSYG